MRAIPAQSFIRTLGAFLIKLTTAGSGIALALR